MYDLDEKSTLRRSHENPAIAKLYENWLGKFNSHLAHDKLHTHYTARSGAGRGGEGGAGRSRAGVLWGCWVEWLASSSWGLAGVPPGGGCKRDAEASLCLNVGGGMAKMACKRQWRHSKFAQRSLPLHSTLTPNPPPRCSPPPLQAGGVEGDK